MRFGVANIIGTIFQVIGVAFIAGCNAIIVFSCLHYVDAYKGKVTSWIGPCVIGGLEGFLIGAMFMSVYSFASDTILQSFLVDEQLNRPDANRPQVMEAFIAGVDSQKKDDE